MHSDLKKLLRFTSLQTKILLTVIAVFSMIAVYFIFLYSRTEIHAQLSLAQNGFSERMINLDNKIENFSNHVIQMRDMARLYMDSPGLSGMARETGPLSNQRSWEGMQMNPDMAEDTFGDMAFQSEFAMAANLFTLQHAMISTGSHVVRSYYYSKNYRFLTSYPPMAYGRGAETQQLQQSLESYLRLDRQGRYENPFWTGPYFDRSLSQFTMTCAAHLYHGGRLTGALGIDISMDALSGYTDPVFDGNGHVLLANQSGAVLSLSDKKHMVSEKNETLTLSEELPEPLRSNSREWLNGDTQGFILEKGYLVHVQASKKSPLYLICTVSIKDFIAYMVPKMRIYFLSIVTAITCFIIGVYIMITRFIKPTRLAEIALQRAHDELEIRVNERTTELSRINEALKESREKYRQLFIYAPAGIYEIDYVLGKFVSVNDVMCEYSGYTKEEFLDLNPFDLLTEQGKKIFKDRLTRVLNGENISRNVELDIYTKNGTLMSVVLNNSYIFEGDKIRGARVVLHDISERKIAEKALRKSEERFRNLVESTTDWIWDIDYKGDFVYSSPSVEAITGYTPEDLHAKRFINYFPIHEREKLYMTLMKNIRPGEVLPTLECSIQTKDGKMRILETRGVHYFDDSGNFQGVRGISRDITEKKKSEAERTELQKTLDRAKKMEALGLLAGGVAHDLNNILSGIINYPELILLDLPLNSPIREHVKAIYSSGKKAAAIVDDLITVARGAARKKEVVNLNSVISEYLQSAEYTSMITQNPDVSIRVTMDKNLNHISTSSVQVRKALLNLVINAVEAVNGKGAVTISSQNIELTSPLRGYSEIPPGEYVLLSVADTGGGISPEDMERIFEPFYSKKVMGRSGTGLGLAIVWNTVTDHGGHINVTSGKNGSVFDLYFPSTRIRPMAALEPLMGEHAKGKGQKILVVDDETLQREIATQLLDSLRYSSVAMESGEKAVEYLKKDQVDVVLLDMVMEPGMSGRETYEKIIELNPAQKVVITTGYADTKEVKLAQEKGAGELLKKPYTLEELGNVISRQLGN